MWVRRLTHLYNFIGSVKNPNPLFKMFKSDLAKENHNKPKKPEVSEFDTSGEMVAGAGFEPTTFGL